MERRSGTLLSIIFVVLGTTLLPEPCDALPESYHFRVDRSASAEPNRPRSCPDNPSSAPISPHEYVTAFGKSRYSSSASYNSLAGSLSNSYNAAPLPSAGTYNSLEPPSSSYDPSQSARPDTSTSAASGSYSSYPPTSPESYNSPSAGTAGSYSAVASSSAAAGSYGTQAAAAATSYNPSDAYNPSAYGSSQLPPAGSYNPASPIIPGSYNSQPSAAPGSYHSSPPAAQRSYNPSPGSYNTPSPAATGSYSAPSPVATGSYAAPPPAATGSYAAPPPAAVGSYTAPPPESTGPYGAPSPAATGSYGAPSPAATGSYGAPPPAATGSYGAPSPTATGSYGAPSPAATGSYGAPSPVAAGSYAASPPAVSESYNSLLPTASESYNAPLSTIDSYNAPSTYNTPPPAYNPPTTSYDSPPPPYNSPNVYNPPSPAYNMIQSPYGTAPPPPCSAPPSSYNALPDRPADSTYFNRSPLPPPRYGPSRPYNQSPYFRNFNYNPYSVPGYKSRLYTKGNGGCKYGNGRYRSIEEEEEEEDENMMYNKYSRRSPDNNEAPLGNPYYQYPGPVSYYEEALSSPINMYQAYRPYNREERFAERSEEFDSDESKRPDRERLYVVYRADTPKDDPSPNGNPADTREVNSVIRRAAQTPHQGSPHYPRPDQYYRYSRFPNPYSNVEEIKDQSRVQDPNQPQHYQYPEQLYDGRNGSPTKQIVGNEKLYISEDTNENVNPQWVQKIRAPLNSDKYAKNMETQMRKDSGHTEELKDGGPNGTEEGMISKAEKAEKIDLIEDMEPPQTVTEFTNFDKVPETTTGR